METKIDSHLHDSIIQYYAEAGMDYGSWSPGFNMHFGFGSLLKIFRREEMLNRMSDEVLKRLELQDGSGTVADFGCGVGATMRRGAAAYPNFSFCGITIVPWQKSKGEALTSNEINNRVMFGLSDYHRTPFESSSLKGVYAIESACYSPDNLQSVLIQEIHRVLAKGGRVVIADGFLKESKEEMNSCLHRMFLSICRNWALPGMINIHKLKELLETQGFQKVQIEEISWRVAPSVVHVPFVIAKFTLRKLIRGEKLKAQSIKNMKGAFLTMILGLHRRSFGYYIISATK